MQYYESKLTKPRIERGGCERLKDLRWTLQYLLLRVKGLAMEPVGPWFGFRKSYVAAKTREALGVAKPLLHSRQDNRAMLNSDASRAVRRKRSHEAARSKTFGSSYHVVARWLVVVSATLVERSIRQRSSARQSFPFLKFAVFQASTGQDQQGRETHAANRCLSPLALCRRDLPTIHSQSG